MSTIVIHITHAHTNILYIFVILKSWIFDLEAYNFFRDLETSDQYLSQCHLNLGSLAAHKLQVSLSEIVIYYNYNIQLDV